MVPDEVRGSPKLLQFIPRGTWMCVLNFMAIYPRLRHLISWWRYTKSDGLTKVSRSHPLWAMSVCTNVIATNSYLCLWCTDWLDTFIPRATPLTRLIKVKEVEQESSFSLLSHLPQPKLNQSYISNNTEVCECYVALRVRRLVEGRLSYFA